MNLRPAILAVFFPLFAFAQTWEALSMESPEPIQSVFSLGNDSLFAVSGNTNLARIFRSFDAGQTWSETQRSDLGLQYAMGKTPQGALLTCGFEGKGLRSTDNGNTWSPISFGRTDWIMDWTALPNGRLLAVGLNGRCFFSDDDGLTWQSPLPLTNAWLLAIEIDVQGTAWAVGGGGIILKTTDGANWEIVVQDSPNTLTDLIQGNGTELLACGFNGELLSSLDSGTTWQVLRTGPEEWNAMLFRQGQYWLLGNGGMKSATDSLMLPVPYTFSSLTSGHLLPNGHILAGAKNGRIFICQFPIQSLLHPTSAVQLYPNPCQGAFRLQNANAGIWHLNDSQGQRLASFSIENYIEDLTLPLGIPPGTYWLQHQASGQSKFLMVVQ
ncbi:MAG: WD40/YVTN/BNR-like repeat-containing protein [Bacteroidia bacterium]